MAVYLMCVYGDPALRTWFEQAYRQTGKKLDMGASCVRFKSVDALPLDVIGEAVSKVSVEAYVAAYRKVRASLPLKPGAKKTAAKKTAVKKTAVKKTAAKKTAATKKAVAKRR